MRFFSSRTKLAVIVALAAVGSTGAVSATYYWVGYPRVLLRQAEDAIKDGRWLSASSDLERYVQLRPTDARARLLLGRSLLALGPHRGSRAVFHLRQIPDDDRLAPEARVREAELLVMTLHRAADAEAALRAALRIDPDSIPARQGLFRIYWWEGRRTPEAEQWLHEVYELGNEKQQLSALGQLFWMRYAEYPKSQAFPMMQRFLQTDPTDFGARLGLALCFLEMTRIEDGVRLLEECTRERPTDPVPRSFLVERALDGGSWQRAQELLDDWPEPARVTRYWELRGRYLEQGVRQFADAVPCFEHALEERPDHWSTRYRLSQCLVALGRTEDADRERELGDRVAHALLDTRVQRLLDEVLPNIESRPHGCDEIAELYDDVGLVSEGNMWRRLGKTLVDRATGQLIEALATPNRKL
jgi:thioredoxin-like negative regulator of GroEL